MHIIIHVYYILYIFFNMSLIIYDNPFLQRLLKLHTPGIFFHTFTVGSAGKNFPPVVGSNEQYIDTPKVLAYTGQSGTSRNV